MYKDADRGLSRVRNLVDLIWCIELLFIVIRWSEVSNSECETFICAINTRATPDKLIVLAAVDNAFIDMAINFYESSLLPHGIENFLFVGLGNGTCLSLDLYSIPCFQFGDVENSNTKSIYASKEFVGKMLMRIDMLLEALNAGFTVMFTDVDLYFTRNPLPDLEVCKLLLTSAD